MIASRLLQRVIEGLSSGFRQVPQRVRVLETQQYDLKGCPPRSDFLDLVFKPLQSLNNHKYYTSLNPESKKLLMDQIFTKSFQGLLQNLTEIIQDEEKKQQRILKYS